MANVRCILVTILSCLGPYSRRLDKTYMRLCDALVVLLWLLCVDLYM